MSSVIIHIGIPKTGTTSIQKQLYSDSERLLTAGTLVPKVMGSNHTLVAFFASQNRFRETMVKRLKISDALAEEHRVLNAVAEFSTLAPQTIITSEFLFELNTLNEIQRLRTLMSTFDSVKIMIYIRRQDRMFQSEVSQRIKSGQYDEKTILHFGLNRYIFYERFLKWAKVFEKQNIEIVDYDKIDGDIVSDFYLRAGLGLTERPMKRRENTSLDVIKLGVLARFNGIIRSRETAAELRKNFTIFLEKLPRLGPNFHIPAVDVERIARAVNPSNLEMSREFQLSQPFIVSTGAQEAIQIDTGISCRAIYESYPKIRAALREMQLSEADVDHILS